MKLVNENDGEDFAQSDVLAVKIEMEDDFTSANAFTFSSTETHHFLQGKIEGNDETLLTATEYDSGDNVATYRELNLLTTDSFGSFYYAPTIFQYFGYDGFVKDTATAFFEGASLSGYNKPRFNGDYSISVSRSPLNKIKATTTVTVSVNFSTEYNTGGNGGLFIAGDDPGWSANTSYRLTYNDGNIWTGTFALTIGTYVKYIVGPWDGGAATRWESGDNHLITPSTTSISVQGWQ